MTAQADPEFEALLEQVKVSRGSDFTGYKRSTLERRFRKRMDEAGVDTYAAYAARLAADPHEFTALFNTILINVTGFFRDLEAWEALSREVLVPLAARKPTGPIRVWSSGCASGEETYTVVMALAEVLGMDAFHERVKVYATDVDDDALAQARQATYPARSLEAVPEALRERYFEPARDRFAFRPDLRRLVIFGRNDLVRDAPISHLDLLISRNTLMYFNADVQARILNRFHFALDDHGALFLGKAEMLRTHTGLFTPIDLKARLFARVHRSPPLRERLLAAQPLRDDAIQEAARDQLRLRDAVLEAGPWAQLAVSPDGTLLIANEQARALFALSPGDIGRLLQDLTLSYRPVELRSRIDLVLAERRPVRVDNVEHRAAGGDLRSYEVHLTPLQAGNGLMGVAIAFVDTTSAAQLQGRLEEAGQELETAFEELQSTNEELETTNEELQSTIEELETTNEELQSTNEELETMNEELQSTNEELETINAELDLRTAELDGLNAYMGSILASVRVAVVVVDSACDIHVWNRRAEDLWGLRADEAVGRALQNLEIGLPVERLKAPVRAAVEGRTEVEEIVLDAINRRGRPFTCRVTVAPFRGADQSVTGAVLMMEEQHAPPPATNGSSA